jgi:hypothetical protein
MRLITPGDSRAIHAALKELQRFAEAYSWAVDVDFDQAVTSIWNCRDKAWVIDGYLVMVDVITPWYSKSPVLQEWLVLKVYPGGKVSSVPPALLKLAKEEYNCSVVITADSSPVSIVARTYEEAGFALLTRSYFKKV